ncbi:hypothetical protein [Bradyrhizobium sp. OK095]|uniref:hypothetical protein n=1 Tax=Bradyrhizobium sp. OK095 TaxID=1882760 RepID=UPI0008B253A3|nr:hypothetical protein [Bradyrhizobium sp. OK095]SEN84918.1 hypothetical protein SAMN05443254_112134 [Bradyrhizobium sp. OK095]
MLKRGDRRNRNKQAANANNSAEKRDHSEKADAQVATPEPPALEARCCGKSPQDQDDQTEHHRNERNLVKLTAGLLFVGGITFLVLVAHAFIFYWTDETQRASQRAFVAVRDITFFAVGPTISGSDIAYKIGTLWENSGNTETHDLQIGGTLLQVPVGSHPIPPLWSPSGDSSSYVLLPKATLPNFSLQIPGVEINKIRNGNLWIYIFGFAKYTDAFQKRHLTLGCFRLYASQVDYTKAGATGVGGLQCGEYNCADEECLRYKSGAFAVPNLTKLLVYIE